MPAVIALNLHTTQLCVTLCNNDSTYLTLCNNQLLHTPTSINLHTLHCVTLNCIIHLNSVRHHHHHLYCDLDMKLMENLLI